MTKIGRPTGLIGYDTDNGIKARLACETPSYRLVRPRTILYVVMIAAIGIFMLYVFLTRSELGLSVQHDRNPVFATLSDGSIRNGYTLRVLNKKLEQRSFRIEFFGLDNARVEAQGALAELGGRNLLVSVGPDQTLEVKVFVAAPKGSLKGNRTPISFRLADLDTGKTVTVRDQFAGP
jgi:polyferredoxin